MLKEILHELKDHSPFTMFGAMTGILFLMIFRDIPHNIAEGVFYVLHPGHVVLSAQVTTALYCRHMPREQISGWRFWKVLLVGYIGSVGFGTLSDSLIPLWGETLLEMPHRHAHIGFIEKWWLVNPLAIGAIIIGYFKPISKYPHAGHVLLSTWASLFHMIMAGEHFHPFSYFAIFIFLFLAVWLPCCLSDIVFPLFFIPGAQRPQKGHYDI